MQNHKIYEIEQSAKDVLEEFRKEYLTIEEKKMKNKLLIETREKFYKQQCAATFMKLHKFLSHALFSAQQDILSSPDLNFKQWEDMYSELLQLHENKNYKEIFYRRNDIKEQKSVMRKYFDEYIKFTDTTLLDRVKFSI